jgi:hypothetical protein
MNLSQRAWENLVGQPGEAAIESIKRDNPQLHVVKVSEVS